MRASAAVLVGQGLASRRLGRAVLPVLILVCLGSVSVAAQQRAPAASFPDLATRLAPGQQLIVHDLSGKTTRGRFVGIVGDALEIERRPWFRRERRVFAESVVQRIERKDPTWDGNLVGVGVGLAVALVANATCDGGLECLPYVILPVPVGLVAGEIIDGVSNERVFLAPGPPASVARRSSPSAGRVALSVTFAF